ncbi:FAD-binding oxidoreductase [Niabella hibiscisoli]|uniref:FAD-binding oxidoreductase n=1 Tax=Niabella hibiscisoli TaxID=1825928 RepID=UPI001F0EEEB5|nr:FAD-binding oxidoreductase [Niabella hibiscisoli]MCH5716840.1 FAD-binding oxidoreductase [Niabella hibiscisoli]
MKYATINGYIDDASRLNATQVFEVADPGSDSSKSLLIIAQLVKRASLTGKKISIGGARHSMGGHTISKNGIYLDMKPLNYMQLDTVENVLTVGAGALWSDIVPYLNQYGRSVAVMQTNNSFSVGGSISVNCHGWQPNVPPIAHTVVSIRVITSRGDVIECGRDQNAELFSLVLGGYGLFGVVVDVKLKVVRNEMYTARQYIVNSNEYVKAFRELSHNARVAMAYGRINVNPDNFLEEAIISTFEKDTGNVSAALQDGPYKKLRRTVFRASANSNYGKNLRWKAEKMMVSLIRNKRFSRNQLLNESVEVFQNTDTSKTDILHEYFIPTASVSPFIDSLKKIIPSYNTDLLNITIRNVEKDTDTYLRYASTEMFGFVMLFNQYRTPEGEDYMKRLTQKLIDVAISFKGTYYLPYRLHAQKDQFLKAYPQADSFLF